MSAESEYIAGLEQEIAHLKLTSAGRHEWQDVAMKVSAERDTLNAEHSMLKRQLAELSQKLATHAKQLAAMRDASNDVIKIIGTRLAEHEKWIADRLRNLFSETTPPDYVPMLEKAKGLLQEADIDIANRIRLQIATDRELARVTAERDEWIKRHRLQNETRVEESMERDQLRAELKKVREELKTKTKYGQGLHLAIDGYHEKLSQLERSSVSRSVFEECINVIHFFTGRKHKGDCVFTDKADEGCYLCSEAETKMWPRIEKIMTLAQAELKRTEPRKEGDEICPEKHLFPSTTDLEESNTSQLSKPAPEPSNPTPVDGNVSECKLCDGTGWLPDPYDSGIGIRCRCKPLPTRKKGLKRN